MPIDIIKTLGIVLRWLKHSESSKIITFFTEAQGKVTLLAKGARKAKIHTPFDTFSLMEIVYRSKGTREIQLLTQSELVEPFLKVRNDYNKSVIAFGICELLERTSESSDPNPHLFRITVEGLRGLNEAQGNFSHFFRRFQIDLISALGFGLVTETRGENCAVCGNKVEVTPSGRLKFSYEKGGVVCGNCASGEDKILIRLEVLKALIFLSSHNWDKLERLKLSPFAGEELDGLLLGFLRYHIEGFKDLKAKELLKRG
jgi:DNA repair protein RecO (recombination protein O)